MRLQDKVAADHRRSSRHRPRIALGMGREGAKVIVADLQAEKAETVGGLSCALAEREALALDVKVASEQSSPWLAERTFERCWPDR